MTTLLNFWIDNPIAAGITFTILMISDPFLTRYAFSLYKQGYSNYFRSEIFELNTYHQDNIHKNKHPPFKVRFAQFLYWFVVILLLIFTHGSGPLYYWLAGFFILPFVSINVRHIQSILIYSFTRKPDVLFGEVFLSIPYLYYSLRVEFAIHATIWFLVYLLTNISFFLGGTVGMLFLMFISLKWESMTMRKRKKVFNS